MAQEVVLVLVGLDRGGAAGADGGEGGHGSSEEDAGHGQGEVGPLREDVGSGPQVLSGNRNVHQR